MHHEMKSTMETIGHIYHNLQLYCVDEPKYSCHHAYAPPGRKFKIFFPIFNNNVNGMAGLQCAETHFPFLSDLTGFSASENCILITVCVLRWNY